MTAEVKPWPEFKDFAMKHGPTALASELYNYALAAAWESRARCLLAAMKEIRSVHPLMHNGGTWNMFVDDVVERVALPPRAEREG